MISSDETVDPMIALGQAAKRARLKARLSQDELAALASISRRPIYLLESGRGSVRIDTLLSILDMPWWMLGLTLEIQPKGRQG